jgi:hypothetical protein
MVGTLVNGQVLQPSPPPVPRPPLCKHCRGRLAYRPRGLCSRCYFTPAVRESYPPDPANGSDQACRGDGVRGGRAYRSPVGRRCPKNLPLTPTDAMPGTAEKVEVLRERARQGVSLWHPGDACQGPQSKELA